MARVLFKEKRFQPVTLILETQEELEELVKELGSGTGTKLQSAYDELVDYLEKCR